MLTTKSAHRKDITTGLAEMQHRHFATVATIIRGMPADVYGTEQVAEIFADRLAWTNPNFNRARFLAACKEEQSR